MGEKYFLKIATFIVVILATSLNLNAQTLSTGDIAIIAYNADGGDDFAFVALADIPASEVIYFTDNEWNGTAFTDLNEGELTWTNAASILSAGSVVVMTDVSTGSLSASVGTLSGSGFNLGASNEWFYALSSAPATSYTSTPTFLAAFANDAGSGWLASTGLTEGTTAVDFNDDNDGYEYTGARSGESSFSDYRAIIYNTSNWSIQTSDGELILPIDATAFTTGAASPGISLGSVSGNTNESGTTATFTVVLDAQPATDVVLNISSGDTGEVTLDLSTLTFTNANWDTPQTVTATGVDDALQDGDVDVTITVSVDDANSDDSYDPIADETTTITNEDDELPNLVINEFQADPDSTSGDANGDGSVSTSDDEFIEIYNASGGELNIGDYTIEDSAGLRHTFPKGTILPTGGTIVVFGGGTPTGIPSLTQTASAGFLGLNNGGDTIIIKDAAGSTVTSYSYGSEGGNNISLARNPDLTGSFVTHDNVTGNGGVLFSPGRDNTDNSGFYKTWAGTTNDWSSTSNWLDMDNPSSATDNIYIPAGASAYPTVTSAVTANATFIGSGATLIAQSTYSGTVYYHRTLGTTNWYLVSSPVGGEDMTGMRANNNFATGTAPNIGFAPYDNSQADPNNRWDYFANTATTALGDGQGYSVKLASTGNVTFVGSMNVNDFNSINLNDNSGASGNAFNLVGNPYTSYVNISSLLTANDSGGNDLLTESTIWIWNEATSSYDQRNSATVGANAHIAPGQGFFVSADGSSATFSITETMQSHQGTDSFQKNTSSRPEIKLNITDGKVFKHTDIYYIDNKTTGWDNGYDSSIFGGSSSSLEVFTELVFDNQGKRLGIQSLPNSDFENMIIPVGLIADANNEITFTVNANNLPAGIKVYLEDRTNNVFTQLDQNGSEYRITLNQAANGIGQFYLHTTSEALSVDSINANLDKVSMYLSNKNTLNIVGVQSGNISLSLFNILGKEVLQNSFSSDGVNQVTLPNLTTGMYIAKLKTEVGTVTKKLIIE